MDILKTLCTEFAVSDTHIKNIVELIDDGNTIPFIARYRKEMTGSCDDQKLREINDRLTYLRNLEKRKEEVLSSIEEQGKLTEEISAAVAEAVTLAEVEDIYRPYKQKRKTRASVAKEKGLEPLADLLLSFTLKGVDLNEIATEYVDPEKGVETPEEALQGASDIIAERISDSPDVRRVLKDLITKRGVIKSVAKTEDDSVYSMYYEYQEPVSKIPSHRILAINRGEKEGFLKVSVEVEEDTALSLINQLFIKEGSSSTEFCRDSATDSYSRLILPSLERETRTNLTEKADEQAIKMFGSNLKPLLMQPPIKNKTVLAVDPAYRTGCKLAVVDGNSRVLFTGVIYPTPPQSKILESEKKVLELIDKYKIDCISIGNGTASKESEIFIADTIKKSTRSVSYMVVNEAGASVYSASKLGAEEFPDFDVSVRSAVSIARRLQDPLSELVKIEPKSIGVGQYQHDVPPARLEESLSGVVEDCVNSVGVDLNTASVSLLKYISGISSSTARNIVAYREENGAFSGRSELKKVKGLGPKAYQQCAGFLRIPKGKTPLDNTGVHPESYDAAKKLLDLFGYSQNDVATNGASGICGKVKDYGLAKAAEECGVGTPTLTDIIGELEKPGRDIRDDLPKPMLRSDIMDMNDLKEGMELTGTVRNVIDFGVFVDIGVHQDGLVHISQICDRFIKHPSEVLKVGEVVNVKVLGVDANKKRISLTMKGVNQ
ncbi:MAG: RNA-binding transcriptional accessory protein [Ruminococcaceae bacterium]|nr:RNA-binding transcriptional accessory protein [Oscillospiraceae bacterium]